MQILQNPDVFCFADYPHRQVQLDLLKVQPEDTNKETANWCIFSNPFITDDRV